MLQSWSLSFPKYNLYYLSFSRLIWTSQFVSQLWVGNRLDSSMIRWIGWGLCSFLFRLLSMVLCAMLNMIEYLWQANQTRLCGWYVVLIFKECARKYTSFDFKSSSTRRIWRLVLRYCLLNWQLIKWEDFMHWGSVNSVDIHLNPSRGGCLVSINIPNLVAE